MKHLFRFRQALRWLGAALALALLAPQGHAAPVEVAFAGFAYGGAASTIAARFPYAQRYEQQLRDAGDSAFRRARQAMAERPDGRWKLVERIDELQGRTDAVALALVLSEEAVSVERIGTRWKLLVHLHGQALFFDFKSMAVLRAYPIHFAALDSFDHEPAPQEILPTVRVAFEGAGASGSTHGGSIGDGLFARFGDAVGKVESVTAPTRTLQVTRVALQPEALAAMPERLTAQRATGDTWAADLVGEMLFAKVAVPILPYSKGQAIGNAMSMRISDGEVFNLTLPKPDYEVSVELTRLKKAPFGTSAAGTSFIYGAFATLRVEQTLAGKVYMDAALKNGEVKLVPATQDAVDDFPAYYDAVAGLFTKLAGVVAGPGDRAWLRSASSTPDIDRQIAAFQELVKLCK